MKFESFQLKHVFSDPEYTQMARQQAGRLGELSQLEAEAKSIATDFKARMESKKAELQSLSVRVNSGFEMRSVKCLLISERPEGYCIHVRLNGRIEKRRKLDLNERQMKLITDQDTVTPYVAIAMLPVDDPDWGFDFFQCPVTKAEFEELRHVVQMMDYEAPVALIEA